MVFKKLALDSVNRAVQTVDGIAGKAVNVAKVLKALGEDPVAMGFIGGDRGQELKAAIEARGIATDFVVVPERTRQCITVIDDLAGTQTELVEESKGVSQESYGALTEALRRRIRNSTALILSGTLTPGASAEFYFQCVQTAHEHGVFAAVDAQGPALIGALKAQPDLVKPNRMELAATVGRELADEGAAIKAIMELCERGTNRVVVTAGKAPTLAGDGEMWWRVSSPPVQAVNPIGSGDAFTAGVVSRLLRGDDLGAACRWGAACGAANALNLMAGEVIRENVENLAAKVKVERVSPG